MGGEWAFSSSFVSSSSVGFVCRKGGSLWNGSAELTRPSYATASKNVADNKKKIYIFLLDFYLENTEYI